MLYHFHQLPNMYDSEVICTSCCYGVIIAMTSLIIRSVSITSSFETDLQLLCYQYFIYLTFHTHLCLRLHPTPC